MGNGQPGVARRRVDSASVSQNPEVRNEQSHWADSRFNEAVGLVQELDECLSLLSPQKRDVIGSLVKGSVGYPFVKAALSSEGSAAGSHSNV